MIDAIVIGGGLAGLSAAWTLSESGYHVLLLERENRLGGRVWTRSIDGVQFEQGAQFIQHHFYQLRKTAKKLRISLHRIPFALDMYVGGTWQTGYYDRLRSVSKLPGLQFEDRFEITRFVVRAWVQRRFIQKHFLEQADQLAMYLQQKYGQRVSRFLIEPFYQSMMFAHPNDGSVDHVFQHFTAPYGQRLYVPEMGMSEIVNGLSKGIQTIFNANVTHIAERSAETVVSCLIDGEKCEFRSLFTVIAVPAPLACDLIMQQNGHQRWTHFLKDIKYASTISVLVEVPKQMVRHVYGMSIPPVYGSPIASIVCKSQSVWNVMLTSQAAQRLQGLTDSKIGEQVLNEIRLFFGEHAAHVKVKGVHRWPLAIPLYPSGRMQNLRDIQKEEHPSRIYLAGDYMDIGCTEGAVRSGVQVAEQLRKRL